ncbi:MAG: hypothetical protein ACK5MP_08990 [Nostocoides sp.]
MTRVSSPDQSQQLTRSARRALRDGVPVGGADSAPLLPLSIVGALCAAVLLTSAAYAGPLELSAATLIVGLVLAWGWPQLLGMQQRTGTSAILALVALGAAAATLVEDDPYLRWLPLVIAGALVLTFVGQLVRRDGRLGLTGSVAATLFGAAVVVLGSVLNPLARTINGPDVVAVVMTAATVGAAAELFGALQRWQAWLLPIAMLLGGWAGVLAGLVTGDPAPGQALLVGVLSAAVSFALRRLLSVLPHARSSGGQLTISAAGIASVSVVAYVLARIFVG